MTEYQVTSWQQLPSLVVARDGDEIVKTPMTARFQEAIDETAMRLGETSSEAYLEGWVRTEWLPADGSPTEVCDRVVADLESQWSDAAINAFLASL